MGRSKEAKKRRMKAYRHRNPNKVKERLRKYLDKHREKYREHMRFSYLIDKLEAIHKYSDGTMKCVLCREGRLGCLSIDHIEGGGRAHRKQIKRVIIYGWLRMNNYPPGFRVLCMNCQFLEAERRRADASRSYINPQ